MQRCFSDEMHIALIFLGFQKVRHYFFIGLTSELDIENNVMSQYLNSNILHEYTPYLRNLH